MILFLVDVYIFIDVLWGIFGCGARFVFNMFTQYSAQKVRAAHAHFASLRFKSDKL